MYINSLREKPLTLMEISSFKKVILVNILNETNTLCDSENITFKLAKGIKFKRHSFVGYFQRRWTEINSPQ